VLRCWRQSRLKAMIAVAALVGAAAVAPFAPADRADASAQDCWQWVRVITGTDENGDPVYGWRLRNPCSNPGTTPGGTPANTCRHEGLNREFQCYHPVHGWWNHTRECYASQVTPQPPASDLASSCTNAYSHRCR
jgi:hypothetical protein